MSASASSYVFQVHRAGQNNLSHHTGVDAYALGGSLDCLGQARFCPEIYSHPPGSGMISSVFHLRGNLSVCSAYACSGR